MTSECGMHYPSERYADDRSRHMRNEENVMPAGFRACASCDAICYPGDRYCSCCGEPLAGKGLAPGSRVCHPIANYCSNCGTRLDLDSSPYGLMLREHQHCTAR